jgi:hypothetical protein
MKGLKQVLTITRSFVCSYLCHTHTDHFHPRVLRTPSRRHHSIMLLADVPLFLTLPRSAESQFHLHLHDPQLLTSPSRARQSCAPRMAIGLVVLLRLLSEDRILLQSLDPKVHHLKPSSPHEIDHLTLVQLRPAPAAHSELSRLVGSSSSISSAPLQPPSM